MVFLKKRILVIFLFLVVTINMHAQCMDYNPLNLSSGVTIIYTDSLIVDGFIIYTDSLVVEISTTYDSTMIGDSIVYTIRGTECHIKNYPFTLTDDTLFARAVFRNDCEFRNLMLQIYFRTRREQLSKLSSEKEKYFILSANNRFINYGLISEEDNEFYAEYSPIDSDISFSQRQYDKLMDWVIQEIDNGRKVSIMSRKNKRRYIVKSFDIV